MNNTHHNIKQLTQQRLLWMIIIGIWFTFVNISVVHAEQHELSKGIATDYQCQLCTNNFSHTPFVLATPVTFLTSIQTSYINHIQNHGLIRTHQLTTYNRGPPTR